MRSKWIGPLMAAYDSLLHEHAVLPEIFGFPAASTHATHALPQVVCWPPSDSTEAT
jgi:hypothetical protein